MGCISSSEQKEAEITKSSRNLNLFLESLVRSSYTQMVLVKQNTYNYTFDTDSKIWRLRKRNQIFTVDNLIKGRLNIRSHERNVHTSQFSDLKNTHVLLRPLRNTLPTLDCAENIRFLTTLSRGDTFPMSIYGQLLEQKQPAIHNLSFNGKYTFAMKLDLNNLASLKGFHRFQSIFNVKISQLMKHYPIEFYGLLSLRETIQLNELFNRLKQIGWLGQKFLIYDPTLYHQSIYTVAQIFNYSDEDGKVSQDLHQFFIIDPNGKVLRAETAEFYIPSKKDGKSQSRLDDFDDAGSQKSKSVNYEKKLLKELHLHQANLKPDARSRTQPITLPPTHNSTSQLNKQMLTYQQIVDSLDQISDIQYIDFKNLFKSQRLQQILQQQRPGEEFCFELIRQRYFIYDHEAQKFLQNKQANLLPTIFPAASNFKQKKVHEICRILKECIGLKWKDPDLSIFSLNQEHSIHKSNVMELLTEYLEKKLRKKVQLYFLKNRLIQWRAEPLGQPGDYAILSGRIQAQEDRKPNVEPILKQIKWVPSSSYMKGIQFVDHYTIKNLPVRIEKVENIAELKEFDGSEVLEDPNLNQKSRQVLKEFFEVGVSYEVQPCQHLLKFTQLMNSQRQMTELQFQNEKNHIFVLDQIVGGNHLQLIEIKYRLVKEKYGFVQIVVGSFERAKQLPDHLTEVLHFNDNLNFGLKIISQLDIINRYFGCVGKNRIITCNQEGVVLSIEDLEQFEDNTEQSTNGINNGLKLTEFVRNYIKEKEGYLEQHQSDEMWKKIKQECFEINQMLSNTINRNPVPSVFQQDLISIKSAKALYWDSHYYQFTEFNNVPSLECFNLTEEQILNLGRPAQAIQKMF